MERTIWRQVTSRSYKVKKGDILTCFDETPEMVLAGDNNYGYVVSGVAGKTMGYLVDDYDPDDEPRVWTKTSVNQTIRLALDKTFSKPLPLP